MGRAHGVNVGDNDWLWEYLKRCDDWMKLDRSVSIE